jgi:hypothetical protein
MAVLSREDRSIVDAFSACERHTRPAMNTPTVAAPLDDQHRVRSIGHRFTTPAYCGEAPIFVASFTGGSILMLGP